MFYSDLLGHLYFYLFILICLEISSSNRPPAWQLSPQLFHQTKPSSSPSLFLISSFFASSEHPPFWPLWILLFLLLLSTAHICCSSMLSSSVRPLPLCSRHAKLRSDIFSCILPFLSGRGGPSTPAWPHRFVCTASRCGWRRPCPSSSSLLWVSLWASGVVWLVSKNTFPFLLLQTPRLPAVLRALSGIRWEHIRLLKFGLTDELKGSPRVFWLELFFQLRFRSVGASCSCWGQFPGTSASVRHETSKVFLRNRTTFLRPSLLGGEPTWMCCCAPCLDQPSTSSTVEDFQVRQRSEKKKNS